MVNPSRKNQLNVKSSLPINWFFLDIMFIGYLGLVINLNKPSLDWINMTYAVKQSASTMIVLFSGMAILITLCAGGYLLAKYIAVELVILICIFIEGIATYVLRRYPMTKGVELFRKL